MTYEERRPLRQRGSISANVVANELFLKRKMLYEVEYKFYKALLFSENEIETINNLNSMTKKPNDLYLDPKPVYY